MWARPSPGSRFIVASHKEITTDLETLKGKKMTTLNFKVFLSLKFSEVTNFNNIHK